MAENGTSTVLLKGIFEQLADAHHLPKKVAHDLLTGMVDGVTRHLKQGDRIRMGGLGTLEVRRREARTGRNLCHRRDDSDCCQQEGGLSGCKGVERSRLKCRLQYRALLRGPRVGLGRDKLASFMLDVARAADR